MKAGQKGIPWRVSRVFNSTLGPGPRRPRFTDDEVREIRRLKRDLGLYDKDIAARYGVSPGLIRAICKGTVYQDVTDA